MPFLIIALKLVKMRKLVETWKTQCCSSGVCGNVGQVGKDNQVPTSLWDIGN
jgi:hypothetical protein